MKLRDKKTKLSKLIREYFLLVSERRDGKYFCPLRKRVYPSSRMHVAHYIDKNRYATRYEVDNLLLVSEDSNVWDAQDKTPGHKSVHHKDYYNFIGAIKAHDLEVRAKEDIIMSSRVIDDYIEFYNNLIKEYGESKSIT